MDETEMNITETMNKVDNLLSDRGLSEDGKEQAVRLLLYHLYVAIDIYRFMTCAEKNKAGYWYRVFRSSFTMTGVLKERKRKRDKEKSPLHPSYKERETEFKEKEENVFLLPLANVAKLFIRSAYSMLGNMTLSVWPIFSTTTAR